MIELNCTYEESKKILELGYDFSPVCPFYRVIKGKSISIFNGIEFIPNLGLVERLESEVLAELGRREIHSNTGKSYRKHLLEKNIFIEITPIIPKAALEACLPSDGDLKGLKWLAPNSSGHFTLLELDDGVFEYTGRLSSFALKNFDSAFEAFLWCHENYPAELKKKFDEVIT
jgi:hypothetical protein